MINNKKLYSTVLASIAMIVMLVSIAGAAPFAYVANGGDNTISVIDTATNTVTATVNVGDHPQGVAVSLDGSKVYVTNYCDISVIDTTTDTVTATIPVKQNPTIGVAVTPDGAKVYVTSGYRTIDGDITRCLFQVTDTATNTVTSIGQFSGLFTGVTVSPDGKNVYLARDVQTGLRPSKGEGYVSVIDTASNEFTASVKVGRYPIVAVTPDGTKVYVANRGSNNVSVIDTATNTVTATIDVGQSPCGVVIGPLPAQQIQYMNTCVQDLVTSGVLNKGQSNALIVKLKAATQNLDAGNTKAATNELNAFINQVNAFKGKQLSSTEAQVLIDAANSMINDLKTS